MAFETEEYVNKLVLDTQQSEDAARRLRAEIELLTQALRRTSDQVLDGAISEEKYREESARLVDALREKKALLEEVAGSESGGAGGEGSGFAGLSRNVFKAERAFEALTTGKGLARAAPMLESVATALGLGTGVGYAVVGLMYAIDTILPHLEKFFGGFDAEKIQEAAEAVKHFAAEAKALTAPEKGETEKQVSAAFRGWAGQGFDVASMAAGAIGVSPTAAVPTYEQQRSVEIYRMAGGGAGAGAGLAALGLATSPDQLQKQLADANMQRAQKLVAQAAWPGQAGKMARAELRRLARDNPGAFPPEFEQFLADVEPEALASARQADMELDAQNEERLANQSAQFAANKGRNRKNEEVDRLVDAAGAEADRIREEQIRDTRRAERDEARAKERTDREIERNAREAERIAERAQRQAGREGPILPLVRENTFGFDEGQQRQIARFTGENMQMGMEIGDAMGQAVRSVMVEIQRGFQRRMQATSEPFVGQ